jgi:solute carrier family 35 protein F1/2
LFLISAQNFAFYITLATVFTTILACRPAERNLFPVLKMRGWKYALVALADAEANFLVVKAYQFTSLTSVQVCKYGWDINKPKSMVR